jgi:uncharacterized protein
MNGLKLSQYNHFVEFEDRLFLIYNARSGALLKTKKDLFEKLKDLGSGKVDLESIPSNHLKTLQSEEVLIDKDLDEKKRILVNSLRDRFSGSNLVLTLAPTLDCMCACSYCYEQNRPEYMGKEIQEEILLFLEQRLKTIRKLDVVWYGGEPLMAAETVFSMSEAIHKLCESHNASLSLSMITNGVLLTRDIAMRMHEVGINSIQVTLDGPREIHDARRQLIGGGGTFDTIIENLSACEGVIPDIILRVNVDRDNFERIQDLEDFLNEKDILNFCDMELSLVDAISGSNTTYGSKCLSSKEFSDINLEFLVRNLKKENYFPEPPRGSSCGAIAENGYIVGPDGSLFKCWSEIGYESKKVGHIKNIQEVTPVYDNWLSFDIFAYEECSDCSFLPMCMGSCPKKIMEMGGGNCCTRWKHNFEEMILMFYASKTKKLSGRKRDG